MSSAAPRAQENRNTPRTQRGTHVRGHDTARGMAHSHSLQMHAGSIGKQTYFPTGQSRARPLSTSTTTALAKRHRTADDSVSTLCVLEQPQCAGEQHGHTSRKHTTRRSAAGTQAYRLRSHSRVTVCCQPAQSISRSNDYVNCSDGTAQPAPVHQQLQHWNNLTACRRTTRSNSQPPL